MFRNLLLSERNHPIRCLANWQLTTQTIQPSPGCGGRCAPRSMSMSWSRALVVARGGGGDGDTIDRLVTCNDYCKWRVFFPKEKKREEVMVKRWSLEFTVCFFFSEKMKLPWASLQSSRTGLATSVELLARDDVQTSEADAFAVGELLLEEVLGWASPWKTNLLALVHKGKRDRIYSCQWTPVDVLMFRSILRTSSFGFLCPGSHEHPTKIRGWSE